MVYYDLANGPRGLWLVHERRRGLDDDVVVRRWSRGHFGPARAVPRSAGNVIGTAIAQDAKGRLAVAWYDSRGERIRVAASRDGRRWSRASTLGRSAGIPSTMSVGLGPDGRGLVVTDRSRFRAGASRAHTIASMSSPASVDFYDAELRAHHEHLRAVYGIGPGDEVVDIGCGAGLTTREAARAAAPGRVLGVDVSERMLQRARQQAAAERLDNVRYELGDAQVHRFDPAGFDVAISRFGTMFFSDPDAAFANIAAALRPEARLVLLVWQRRERNEWARAIDAALGDAARPWPQGSDPFSLGDAESTARILEGAGFDGLHFEDVHEPVFYGHDLDAALAFVRGFQNTSAALASLSDGEAARAIERLRETLAAHYSVERGVVLGSRSWLITARRRR